MLEKLWRNLKINFWKILWYPGIPPKSIYATITSQILIFENITNWKLPSRCPGEFDAEFAYFWLQKFKHTRRTSAIYQLNLTIRYWGNANMLTHLYICQPELTKHDRFFNFSSIFQVDSGMMSGQSVPGLYGHLPWVCLDFEMKLL